MENLRADPLFDPPNRYPGVDYKPETTGRLSPLDAPEMTQLHQRLLGVYGYEKRRQAPNRWQMALDCDYYDGIQFDEEDIQELLDRGQAPLVYNLVKRTADWVIGTEKRTRFDFKIHGRTKDDVENARIKTDVMKYYQDVNRDHFHRSQAFKETVVAGLGWLEDGVRGDPDEEPIFSRHESWWFMLHDSHSLELDYTDARYHFRSKFADVDLAEAMFPDRKYHVQNTAKNADLFDERMIDEFYLGNRITGEDYLTGSVGRFNHGQWGMLDNSRDRVRIYECWYRKPMKDRVVRSSVLPQFHGRIFDAANQDMAHAVIIGDATVVERVAMATHYAIFTDSGMLAHGRSPYRHNRIPFTPIWCYRRGRDGMPYGMIRNIRDPQDGFNRRMSKAIFALSAYRVDAESNAIDEDKMSWEDVRNEAGRPDALMVRKPGTKLEVSQDRALGEEHLKIAQTEGSLILDASGVTADNLGMESNAQSGKAIIAKQAEGSAVTAEIFDNYRLACQLHGELKLSLVEQYVSEEKVIRITDGKGRPTWKKVNEVTQDPDGTVRILNDVTAAKADFIIDEEDFHASRRQAASEALMDVSGKMGTTPQIALRILRMAADLSDWPNKDEIVKELDAITGHSDPNDAMTDDEKAKQQQQQQTQQAQQQEQAQMQKDAFTVDLDTKRADAEKKKAEAEKILADAEKVRKEIEQQALAGQNTDAVTAAVNEVQTAAQEQIRALNERIAELVAETRNRELEHNNRLAAEQYKADKTHDAQIAVARESRPAPTPAPVAEHQNMLADLSQDVAHLTDAVKAIAKSVEQDKKDDEREREQEKKEREELAKRVEKAAADAVKAAEAREKEPKTASAPAAPPVVNVTIEKGAIQVDNNITPAKPTAKEIKISDDGKSATVTPKKD